MHRRTFGLVALGAAFGLAAAARADGPMPVVATFSVIGDIVRQIGGERVAVTILVPPDGDAHTYEPKPADLIAIRQARVVVVNGLGMEGWMDRLVRASGTKAEIVVATRGVVPRRMVEEGHATTDPHAWQDPRNGLIYASNVADGLSRADPAGAAVYRAGADRLSAALRETDTWIAAQFAGIAPARRKIITSHDAFGYFGARYGIAFVGVQGVSTDAEPSARDIAALVAQIRRERVKAVFVENMTDPRVAAALAREAGASVGPTVYSDALSPPGGPADTYLGMFRHNVPLFARAMAAN